MSGELEEWRRVAGFANYEVSSCGRVRRVSGRVLKPYQGRYLAVTLYNAKRPYCAHIHRLVCVAFNGPPPSESHHAAHTDGNRLNNVATNLRWATPNENQADKIVHGTTGRGKPSAVPVSSRRYGADHGRHTKPERTARGERGGTAKLTEQKVTAIRLDSRSRKEIAAAYGITVTAVGYIKRGISWAHVPMPQAQEMRGG